jgi:hypothetical protein
MAIRASTNAQFVGSIAGGAADSTAFYREKRMEMLRKQTTADRVVSLDVKNPHSS